MIEHGGVEYAWRGMFTNAELNALHAEGFEHRALDDDWLGQLERWSLGWVIARQTGGSGKRDGHEDAGEMVGFANVAWDGGVHAFLLDTTVAAQARRQGIATELVRLAVAEAQTVGCEWLHVDFEPHLRDFYWQACGFRPTHAGLIALR